MKSIKLPRTLANRLLTHAQKSAPDESCGLISQSTIQKETLFQVYPIDNIAAQAEQFFEMHPQQQIAAMKNMRDAKEDFFAIYHSHPTSPALPSNFDLEQMAYSDVYYLIISLNTIGVLEMKAYQAKNSTLTEVGLEIN